MRIQRHEVAYIPKVYSLTWLPGDREERLAFAAGSEAEGPLVQFMPPGDEPCPLADTPGGFISLCPLTVGGRRYLVAATRFLPVFRAADCRIVLYPLDRGDGPAPTEVMALPYTHRVAVACVGRQPVFLGSTLCSRKDFTEDWSHAGGITMARIPADPETSWQGRLIVDGLTRHHGFDFARLRAPASGGFLLSADEGLFFLRIPRSPADEWTRECLAEGPHSDACAFDLRRAGRPDIVTISPFHGNVLRLYRQDGHGWRAIVMAEDLDVGHVVWAGRLMGEPAILAGGRGGRAELRLYRPADRDGVRFRHDILDEGVGATQILVDARRPDRAVVVVAAHAIDRVLRYELTA